MAGRVRDKRSENIFSSRTGGMGVVIIPFDYELLPDAQRQTIVTICISSADLTRYDEVYERELLVELVERRIEKDHREEIREVFKMLRQGYTWDEIATRLHDPKPEAVKKRFWRWIKRNFPKTPQQKPLHPGGHMP